MTVNEADDISDLIRNLLRSIPPEADVRHLDDGFRPLRLTPV